MRKLGLIALFVVTATFILFVVGYNYFIRSVARNFVHGPVPQQNIGASDTSPVSIKQQIDTTTLPKIISSATDTTIMYDIEGESEEGSEVEAHYMNQKISKAQWRIFGETGKLIIDYDFRPDGAIDVVEKKYGYRTDLTQVKSGKDIHLKSTLRYTMDTTGTLFTKVNVPDFYNSFKTFKQNVPLQLFRK